MEWFYVFHPVTTVMFIISRIRVHHFDFELLLSSSMNMIKAIFCPSAHFLCWKISFGRFWLGDTWPPSLVNARILYQFIPQKSHSPVQYEQEDILSNRSKKIMVHALHPRTSPSILPQRSKLMWQFSSPDYLEKEWFKCSIAFTMSARFSWNLSEVIHRGWIALQR